MTDYEFLEESSTPDAGDDDVIDTTQRRRAPRWVLAVGAVALAAFAVVVVARQHPASTPGAAGPSGSEPAPSGPQTAPPLLRRGSPMIGRLDSEMLEVYIRAHDPEPASDVVRTSSDPSNCTGVRIGATSPRETSVVALIAHLHGYRMRDTARILDQNAGLCALQVRGRTAAGASTVLTVVSPIKGEPRHRPAVREADGHLPTEWVRYVQTRTAAGWIVTVGAVGPERDLPSTSALRRVATDPRVRW